MTIFVFIIGLVKTRAVETHFKGPRFLGFLKEPKKLGF